MHWATALVGFASVMAALSGAVSVFIELLNKVIGTRRDGLKEMLRTLHDDVLVFLHPAEPPPQEIRRTGGNSKAARAFADEMVINRGALGDGRAWARRIPILSYFFNPDFDRLDAVQFVEHMARTSLGQRLADGSREGLRKNIESAVYHFDAYGQQQRDYFKRKAKVVSALIAFAAAAVCNISAWDIFSYLADESSNEAKVMASLRQEDLEKLNLRVAALQSGDGKPSDQDNETYDGMRSDIEDARTAYKAIVEAGLPIGYRGFPFCVAPGKNDEERCSAGGAYEAASAEAIAVRIFSWEGLVWIVGLIATAGFIGLGAPFWFDVSRSLSSIAGPSRPAGTTAPDSQRVPGEIAASDLRGDAQHDLGKLVIAFLTAAGRQPAAPLPPPGGRID